MNKLLNGFSGIFVHFGCLLAEIMNTPVNIAVVLFVIFADGINNNLWFLGCSSIIEINQRTVIYLSFEYREILPYFIYLIQNDLPRSLGARFWQRYHSTF